MPERRDRKLRGTALAVASLLSLMGLVAPSVSAEPGESRAGEAPSRGAVVAAYQSEYLGSLSVPFSWTGHIASCDPGSPSPAFRDASLRMVNYFRVSAGLQPFDRDPIYDSRAQAAALITDANSAIIHDPTPQTTCYTQKGAQGAAGSLLSLGVNGPAAIVAYMADTGVTSLEHRRWLLFPPLKMVGIGDVPRANAVYVAGGAAANRPADPAFVAWPPAGARPRPVIKGVWSFAVNADPATVDMSSAAVSMTRHGAGIPIVLEPLSKAIGDPTISWRPLESPAAPGTADTTIHVRVTGVKVGGKAASYSYDVVIIDPSNPGATCRGREATIVGTSGDDILTGTAGADVIVGRGGNDTIAALGGDDIICSGRGNDHVDAGGGDDWISAGGGNDVVVARVGRDTVYGNRGSDRLWGGPGADRVGAGAARDWVYGGDGQDDLFGGSKRDLVKGGSGGDTMFGGPGDDTLTGNGGTDLANGADGTDVCYAEEVANCEGG